MFIGSPSIMFFMSWLPSMDARLALYYEMTLSLSNWWIFYKSINYLILHWLLCSKYSNTYFSFCVHISLCLTYDMKMYFSFVNTSSYSTTICVSIGNKKSYSVTFFGLSWIQFLPWRPINLMNLKSMSSYLNLLASILGFEINIWMLNADPNDPRFMSVYKLFLAVLRTSKWPCLKLKSRLISLILYLSEFKKSINSADIFWR